MLLGLGMVDVKSGCNQAFCLSEEVRPDLPKMGGHGFDIIKEHAGFTIGVNQATQIAFGKLMKPNGIYEEVKKGGIINLRVFMKKICHHPGHAEPPFVEVRIHPFMSTVAYPASLTNWVHRIVWVSLHPWVGPIAVPASNPGVTTFVNCRLSYFESFNFFFRDSWHRPPQGIWE
jgi:hypothetical protein